MAKDSDRVAFLNMLPFFLFEVSPWFEWFDPCISLRIMCFCFPIPFPKASPLFPPFVSLSCCFSRWDFFPGSTCKTFGAAQVPAVGESGSSAGFELCWKGFRWKQQKVLWKRDTDFTDGRHRPDQCKHLQPSTTQYSQQWNTALVSQALCVGVCDLLLRVQLSCHKSCQHALAVSRRLQMFFLFWVVGDVMSGMWMYLDHLWMQHDAAHGMRVQCSARECKVLHFFEQYLEYRQLQKPLRSKFVAANMYEDLRSCMLAVPIFQVLSHSSCARVDPP